MDRLELVPGDVRGGGNITMVKSPDFIEDTNTSVYASRLVEELTYIDGRYMSRFRCWDTHAYSLHVDCNAPRIVSAGDSFNVVVSVERESGDIVLGTSVTLVLRGMDGTVFWSDSVVIEDVQPVFTVNVPSDVDTICEWFVRAYHQVNQGVSWHRGVVVVGDLDFDFNVVGDKSILQTGETCNVVGVLTGTIGDDVIGIPGQTVNFYELWTPGLRVSAPIVQSGDTVDIKAQLIDTTDGSLVRESGHTVDVYWNDAPAPVPTTLDVDFDKTILSYADGDSAYVVVRVYDQLGNAMPNQIVSVSINEGAPFDLETDVDGRTSFSYVSQGDGDVTFTFECSNLQETYELEDCKFYDASSSSNVNKYSVESGTSFSYDSSNSSYSLYPTSAGARWVTLNSYTFSKDNKVSIDFNISDAPTNAQYGFLIGNICCRAIKAGSIQRITIANNDVSSDYTYYDCAISTQEWYTLELLPTGVLNLKQGETIIATCNYDIGSIQGDTNNFKIYSAHSSNTRGNVKNIKIKPL